MAGRGSDEDGRKYVHTLFGWFFSPSSFGVGTNYIFEQWSLLFQLILCFVLFIFPMLLKCLIMLRSSMVISPHGTSETWPPCLQVRSTLFFWLVFFTFYICAALIEFLYNDFSFFFTRFYHFSLLLWCSV